MISIVRILVTSVALVAVTACSHTDEPNCSIPFYNLANRLQGMAKDGRADEAREQAKNYKTCFSQEPRYWLLRGSLVPYANGDHSHLKKDTAQVLEYTDKAIALAPDNGQYKMAKVGGLSELHKDQQAVEIYDQVLSQILSRSEVKTEQQELTRQSAFDVAVPYVLSAQRIGKIEHAKTQLTPLVARACSTLPNYVSSYAKEIIWLDQNLNHKSPDTVKAACDDFAP